MPRRSARIAALHAPPVRLFERISDEVLIGVLVHLYNACLEEDGDLSEFVAATLVDRRFCACAQPLLWRQLSVTTCEKLHKLDTALVERPMLAHSARVVVIGDDGPSDVRCRTD